MAPALPPRRKRTYISNCIFSDLIKMSEQELNLINIPYIYISDLEFLKANFDSLKRLLKTGKFNKIGSTSFECLKYIEENLDDCPPLILTLIDDYEIKDRSYINPLEFTKTTLEIPLSYLLWMKELHPSQKVSLYMLKTYDKPQPAGSNDYEYFSLESLKRIREIISILAEKCQGLSDIEKTILVSNYIQNHVQFVEENNKSQADQIYITDSKGQDVTIPAVGSPENVLLHNYGVCNGIANASMLLLNNPEMRVNVRSVKGQGHVWNVILLDGKYYIFDNTWSITRNKDRYPESLKARSFSSDYLFLGSETASIIGHHTANVFGPIIAQEDLSREVVEESQKRLVKIASFSNYDEPVFASHIQR